MAILPNAGAAAALVGLVNVSDEVLAAAKKQDHKSPAPAPRKKGVTVTLTCSGGGMAKVSTGATDTLDFEACDEGGTTVDGTLALAVESQTTVGDVVTETVTLSGGPVTVTTASGTNTVAFVAPLTLTITEVGGSGGTLSTTVSASGSFTYDGASITLDDSVSSVNLGGSEGVGGGSDDAGSTSCFGVFCDAGAADAGFSGTTLASKQSNPELVATTAADVFWVDAVEPSPTSTTYSVMKVAKKNGGTPTTVVTLPASTQPGALVPYAAGVLWTSLPPSSTSSGEGGAVMKASLTGGGKATALVTLSSDDALFSPLATDGTYAYYWTDGDDLALYRVAIAGGAPQVVAKMALPSSGGVPTFAGLGVDASYVYWTLNLNTDGVVARAPLAGGAIQTLSTQTLDNEQYFGCVVGASDVYWLSDATSTGEYTIYSVPLAGGTRKQLASAPSNDGTIVAPVLPSGFASDGKSLFWSSLQAVVSIPIAGGAVGTVAVTPLQGAPVALAADSSGVYWALQGDEPSDGSIVTAPN